MNQALIAKSWLFERSNWEETQKVVNPNTGELVNVYFCNGGSGKFSSYDVTRCFEYNNILVDTINKTNNYGLAFSVPNITDVYRFEGSIYNSTTATRTIPIAMLEEKLEWDSDDEWVVTVQTGKYTSSNLNVSVSANNTINYKLVWVPFSENVFQLQFAYKDAYDYASSWKLTEKNYGGASGTGTNAALSVFNSFTIPFTTIAE